MIINKAQQTCLSLGFNGAAGLSLVNSLFIQLKLMFHAEQRARWGRFSKTNCLICHYGQCLCSLLPHESSPSPLISCHIPPDGMGCVESALQALVQLKHITWHIKSKDFLHVIVLLSQPAYLDK